MPHRPAEPPAQPPTRPPRGAPEAFLEASDVLARVDNAVALARRYGTLTHHGGHHCPLGNDDIEASYHAQAEAVLADLEVAVRELAGLSPATRLLSADEAEALGLDPTGRDGDPRWPHRGPDRRPLL